MADVYVNETAVFASLGVIAEKRQLLSDANGILKSNLKKISSNWESNGVDKQSYVTALEQHSRDIDNLIAELAMLKQYIERYIEELRY